MTYAAGNRSPVSVFDTLDALCNSFVSEWEAGSSPDISTYLERVTEETRPSLLRNLLVHELRWRQTRGDTPSIENYIERYPEFSNLIREVFLESSGAMLSPDFERTRTVTQKETPSKAPSVQRLGDFRLIRELGRGGMGIVFEAINLRRGDHVALKTLPFADASAVPRFKREFRSAANLNHPNLIGLHNLEADGLQWFFTMDLLIGTEFRSYIRPGGTLDESRLRSALSQLAAGVMALHGSGVVHRDLKPSNVMVTFDDRAVILDFGLVLGLEETGSMTSNQMVGTPGYMAPEQASGEFVTSAADWYSVGVMLYEALCGLQPFTGSMVRILDDKQKLDAPPLPDDPAIPADLRALCMRLLARDPKNRPDALEIARVVAITPSSAASTAGRGGKLLGRESQLSALEEAGKLVDREGTPAVVLVSGRSGEGKTSLVEQYLSPLKQNPRLTVMTGRCYDRESVPFKAIDNLIDALASYLRSLPREDAAILMPDDIAVLAQVFPVLQRVEVVAKAIGTRHLSLDEQQVRQRAFGALRSLLGRIGRRTTVVWFVDDLQWGDADSAEALFEALRPPEAPIVLFIGTFRSDEEAGSPFLSRWKELAELNHQAIETRPVNVEPLTLEHCTQLIIEMIGRDSEEVRRRADEIARQTGGNPFLLVELASCYDSDTDSFRSVPMHEVLARKLGRLPSDAELLLNIVAISGQSLPLDDLTKAAGMAVTPVATLTRMRTERLLRLVGPEREPLVDTYHDKIRETVLGGLPEEQTRGLHQTLGEVIEAGADALSEEELAAIERGDAARGEQAVHPRIFDLAYHFDAAGERRKALAYSLLAAEQAGRQSALEVAAEKYAIARRNCEGASNSLRYRLGFGATRAMMLLGRYQDAETQLRDVLDLGDRVDQKAKIDTLRGELAFKQGNLKVAIDAYCRGLNRLGVRVPKGLAGATAGIIKEAIIQTAHALRPKRLHKKPKDEFTILVVPLLSLLSHPRSFRNTPLMAWTVLKGLNQAERVEATPSLSYAYSIYSIMLSTLGWNSLALKTYRRGEAWANHFDDLWSKGLSVAYKGIGLFASGQYEESVETLAESTKTLTKSGDIWPLNLAHFHSACSRYALGDLAGAVTDARTAFESSARIGDTRSHCSLYIWSKTLKGNIPFEALSGCFPHVVEDLLSTSNLDKAEAYWHLHHGRLDQAIEAFERSVFVPLKNHLVNFHSVAGFPPLVGALRLDAEKHRETDPARSKRQLSRAKKLGERSVWIGRLFPTILPAALRELSLAEAARGKLKSAVKLAEKSIKVAERQKARYEVAQSRLVKGQLRLRLGLLGADRDVAEAEAAIHKIESGLIESANTTPRTSR